MTVIAQKKTSLSLERIFQVVTFDGPASAIVRREVGRMLEERAFRVLVIGLSGVNLLIAYMLYADSNFSSGIDSVARQIVLVQGLFLYAVGFVFTAARAGTCIGTERARDTWAMMWLTPAHPLSIALGHIVAALAPATLLTMSQLPILAPTVYALGGEEWPRIATASAIGYASWIACAAWAFWASAQFRLFGRALAGAFLAAMWSSGILTSMLVGTLVLFSSLASPDGNPSFFAADTLRVFSPVMQLYYVISFGRFSTPIGPHFAYMAIATLIPLFMGARAVRREKEAVLQARRESPGGRLSGRGIAPGSTGVHEILDWMNPIYAVERRIAAEGSSRTGKALFLLFSCFAMYMSFGSIDSGGFMNEASAGIVMVFLIALGMAAWTTASGTAASQEHQTFDMVAMTGLRARDIQRGMVLSALSSVMPLVVLLAACMTIAGVVGDAIRLAFVCFVTFILCIATLMSSGLFASAVTRGTREAVASNILIGLIMHFGVPVVSLSAYLGFQEAVIKNWLGLQRWFSPSIANSHTEDLLAGATSPIVGLAQLLQYPGRWQSWFAWSIGAMVALAWTFLWYNVAGWILRRKLEGRPVWSPGSRSME